MWFRRLTALCVAMVAAVAIWVLPGQPANALTNDEKFILATYEDYLLRRASDDELTWWSAYLAGSTRTSMLNSLFSTAEFRNLWVAGASLYYLGAIDAQFSTVYNNLTSSGNFVASEVELIAGATYYANSGSTNTGYVTQLYQDALLRNGSSGDISYWAGQITSGTRTRAWVANYFIRTSESAGLRVSGPPSQTVCSTTYLQDEASLAAGSYCIVLDRIADSTGAAFWSGQLAGSGQLPTLWASLAGSVEYYNTAQSRY